MKRASDMVTPALLALTFLSIMSWPFLSPPLSPAFSLRPLARESGEESNKTTKAGGILSPSLLLVDH